MRQKLFLCSVGLLLSLSAANIHAQDAILKVMGGGGWPGSTGNVVPIYLNNERSISGCGFDVLLDTGVAVEYGGKQETGKRFDRLIERFCNKHRISQKRVQAC